MARVVVASLLVFTFLTSPTRGTNPKYMSMSCENGVCYRPEDAGPCVMDNDDARLYRWDPIKTGHVREVELEPGKNYKMITRAVKPPLFEIPNFLSDEECEEVIEIAKATGLFGSYLHADSVMEKRQKKIKGQSKTAAGLFRSWDTNKDNVITKDEVITFGKTYKFLYMEEDEVDKMIKELDLAEFDNGGVQFDEFQSLPTAAIDQYMNDLKEKHPKHRDRFSNQAWLHQTGRVHPVLKWLRKRIAKLTKLSPKLIRGSEPLQVVKYDEYGHYNAHYDAQPKRTFKHLKCCHLNVAGVEKGKCRLCRYITILYYLNDVEGGGETAFPVADNRTFDHELYIKNMEGDKFNLMQYCHDGNLVIKPKRGTAIMWYNHFVDEETGWLGYRDDYSLHGGCNVHKGVKWIANNWMTAPDEDLAHLKSNFDVEQEDDEIFYE